MPDVAQPNASRMQPEALETLLASVAAGQHARPDVILYRDQHSNDFAEIRLHDGRSLIVKRGRYDWAAPRFATSRIASDLIREATGVAVPAPLAIPTHLDCRPLEAYWRIDLPTLEEVWPELDRRERAAALHSWGALTAQLHSVRLEGFGPLSDEHTPTRPLGAFLRQELEERLLPAVATEWPAASWIVERLLDRVEEVEERVTGGSRLIHNDMHMGNVLCETEGGVSCVGLIDLETAMAAPVEADLAVMEVHHGHLFAQPIEGRWLDRVHEGYGAPHDSWVVNFYRAFHLLNMGFYSAIIGHQSHAGLVAEAAAAELGSLEA